MPADLHLHTLHSDGSWTPEQLVEAAVQQGLQCIAVTDHDTVAGITAAERAAAGRVELIPGIEINTVFIDEKGERHDIHVLGYFIDRYNSCLKLTMDRQQAARLQLVEDTIARCNQVGIALTMDDIRQCAGEGSIGRPHLARAIVKAGGAPDVESAFKRFSTRNSPDYVARHSVTPQEAINAIHDAGGIASYAHPGKEKHVRQLILMLKNCGLDAVEAYHRGHNLDIVKNHLRFAAQNNMLVTGGSDCHGPAEGYPAAIGSVKVPMDVVHALKAYNKSVAIT